jgi:putative PIN family toxin of toxin-antitoxin system
MRVVIDTNVLVSGVINPHGPPGRIVDAVLAKTLTVLHDDRILSEYRGVLFRPAFGFSRADVETLLDFIAFAGEYVSGSDIGVVLPDPTDLPFLEIAACGYADALITGNAKHFKPRRGHHDVHVCTPAEFLRRT